MSETKQNKESYFTALLKKFGKQCAKLPGRRLSFLRTISLVIDPDSIQMATVQKLAFHSRLLDVTKIYIPASIKDEEVGRNFIINKINVYVKKYRGPFTRYILGAGGQETIFRMLNLPAMPKKELHKAILWEGNKRRYQKCFGIVDSGFTKSD